MYTTLLNINNLKEKDKCASFNFITHIQKFLKNVPVAHDAELFAF